MVFSSFSEYIQLREMSARKQLSRLVSVAQDPASFYVLIAASRRGEEVWKGATKAMENDIRSRGYRVSVKKNGTTQEIQKQLPGNGPIGVSPTHGGYEEKGMDVREKSLFVSLPTGSDMPSDEEIVDFFVTLAEKYQQVGVIIKLPDEETAYEYTTRHHDMGAGHRIAYNDPGRHEKPPYYTRPRYRGTSKKSTASKSDALVFDPDFASPQVTPFSRPHGPQE